MEEEADGGDGRECLNCDMSVCVRYPERYFGQFSKEVPKGVETGIDPADTLRAFASRL